MKQISPQDFAAIAAAALIKNGTERQSLFLDEDNFDLLIKDGHGRINQTIHLNNFYARYLQTEKESEQNRIIDQVLNLKNMSDFAPSTTLEEAAPHLRLRVLPRWFLQDGEIGGEIPHLVIADHIAILIVYDTPENFMYVTGSMLNDWCIDFPDAFDIAVGEMDKVTDYEYDSYRDVATEEPLFHSFSCEDQLAASRVVFADFIRSMPVKGKPIILLPNRNLLVVTGSETEDGLHLALEHCLSFEEEAYSLPLLLFTLDDDDHLCSLELNEDHELFSEFKRMKLKFLDQIYNQQRSALNAQFDQLIGAQTATAFRFDPSDRRRNPFSLGCAFREDIPCLLPKTDFVLFGAMDTSRDPLAIASWETVERVIGSKLEWTELYPQRIMLREFPTVEELETMGYERFPD